MSLLLKLMRKFSNYYKVLEINRFASPSEVRSSFRRLAKIHHPDLNSSNCPEAEIRMRMIIEAYRILIDDRKRAIYDLRFRSRLSQDKNEGFRDHLRKKRDDPYAQAHLILFDLVNNNSTEAIANYERLSAADGNGCSTDFLSLLGHANYLDCIFLLAEAYQDRSQYLSSLRHYEQALREDLKWNYFRDFRKEIQLRIRNLYVRHLARRSAPRKAISYYRKLLSGHDLPKSDRAFINKKIAEAYLRLQQVEPARLHLEEAFRLKPNLAGAKKISRSIFNDRETGAG